MVEPAEDDVSKSMEEILELRRVREDVRAKFGVAVWYLLPIVVVGGVLVLAMLMHR
ncbi:MAG: hypothetical protein M3N53_12950 [Actinomycetota bacterium]|nr:hypothetical protein [Actinomycetota bacterium]